MVSKPTEASSFTRLLSTYPVQFPSRNQAAVYLVLGVLASYAVYHLAKPLIGRICSLGAQNHTDVLASLSKGTLDEIIANCTNALASSRSPTGDLRAKILLLKVTAYFNKNDFDNAKNEATAALAYATEKDTRAKLFLYRGISQRDASEKIKDCTEALACNPSENLRAEILHWRSFFYVGEGRNDLAINDLTKALESPISDKDQLTKILLLRGKLCLPNTERAIQDYTAALESGLSSPTGLKAQILLNRSKAYLSQGRFDLVQRDCTEAAQNVILSKEENLLAKIYYNRGRACFYLKEYDNAIRDYGTALKADPLTNALRAKILLNRGWAYQLKGQLERAINDYNLALTYSSDSKNNLILFTRSEAYRLRGDYELAVKDSLAICKDKYEDTQSKIPFPRASEGDDHIEQNSYALAYQSYTDVLSALDQVPDNSQFKFQFLIKRGDASLLQGKLEEALKDYKEVQKVDKGELAQILFKQGEAYRLHNDPKRAIECYAQAQNLRLENSLFSLPFAERAKMAFEFLAK